MSKIIIIKATTKQTKNNNSEDMKRKGKERMCVYVCA